MWQTDLVLLMTSQDINNYGGLNRVWTPYLGVMCDVQDITRELVYKRYGFDGTEFKQVFDTAFAPWATGDVVRYNGVTWLVKLVSANKTKIARSNHVFVILERYDAVQAVSIENLEESQIMAQYNLSIFTPTPISEAVNADDALIVGNLGLGVIVGE